MEKVKISFNKQTWGGDGTYYRGCFTVTNELYQEFATYVVNYLKKYESARTLSSKELNDVLYLTGLNIEKESFTDRKCFFMKLTQRDKFVQFLQEKGIDVNINRAFGPFNYYMEVR